MATEQEYLNAAKKTPSSRSTADQALVDKGIRAGMQSVKNADFNARRHERVYGR